MESQTWLEGPPMLHNRYQAASVSRNGLVWMLGGRDGSVILQDNEVLFYPATFDGNSFEIKGWQWAHKKMKNKEVWTSGVPEAMKTLPMPLTGHCTVSVNDKFVLVIGGGTNQVDNFGNFITNSEPNPTNHIHLYDFDKNIWHSTYENSNFASRRMKPMHSPRMNHACMMFEEMGRTKIMVAGGVTKTEENNNELTNTVEILDFDHASWKFASDIPKFVTGSKLIEVSGRPTLVGRYGSERQCVLSRYTVDDVWTQLPLSLLHGRSDFQLLRNVPKVIRMFPNLN